MIFLLDGVRIAELPTMDILQPAVAYGCSLFETMRVFRQGLYRPDFHVYRLLRSIERLRWPLPAATSDQAKKTLLNQVFLAARTFCAESAEEGRLRLTYLLTESGYHLVVTVTQQQFSYRAALAKISPVNLAADAEQAGLKSGNFLPYFQARRDALQSGVDEGILLAGKAYLAEGSISNLFFIKNEVLCTPCLSLGVLPGITRDAVISLGKKAGIRVVEDKFVPDDLFQAEAAFFTNAIRGIWPIRVIGNCQYNLTHPVLAQIRTLLEGDLDARLTWEI